VPEAVEPPDPLDDPFDDPLEDPIEDPLEVPLDDADPPPDDAGPATAIDPSLRLVW
jgi:hypothetical protein